jgi:hypothetical protein
VASAVGGSKSKQPSAVICAPSGRPDDDPGGSAGAALVFPPPANEHEDVDADQVDDVFVDDDEHWSHEEADYYLHSTTKLDPPPDTEAG